MDINQRFVNQWKEDTVGRDVCPAMTDRLNGLLSLESADPETYDKLRGAGFDHSKVAQLISEVCEEQAELSDDLPTVSEEYLDVEGLLEAA